MPTTQSHRPWHILATVKGEHVPERIIVVAVEPAVNYAAPKVQEHTFGHGYATVSMLRSGDLRDQVSVHFETAAQFWFLLDSWRSKRATTWVYAHNMGYVLCLLGFWDQLERGSDTLVSCVLSDPPTIITTRRKGRIIKYVDTQNYRRVSLSDLGRSAGCSVSGLDTRAGARESRRQSCERAAKRQSAWLLGLCESLARSRAGAWAATAAGVAWNVYRHSFLAQPIWIHGNMDAIKLERRALKGGRCEVRRSGWINEPIASIDCNSMYPAVMAANQQPHKLIAYFPEPQKRHLYEALSGFFCVADVSLLAQHHPLPITTTAGPVFSSGSGRGVLCGLELVAAHAAAAIAAVHELAVYETADLFSGYVQHMYPRKLAARAAGNENEADFYKLCLNSLYGKFAQKGIRWHDDSKAIAPDRYSQWWEPQPDGPGFRRYRSIGGRCQYAHEGTEPRNTFPAISAGVTAAARVALQGAISVAGESSCCYCDTDSIHVTGVGERSLSRAGRLHPELIGSWKRECEGPDAHYWGPKHYRIGDWWTCNFLSASATEIAHGTFLQDSYSGLETILGTGVVDRVLVQERTIQLPVGNWARLTRLHKHPGERHECREFRPKASSSSSPLPLMQENLLG